MKTSILFFIKGDLHLKPNLSMFVDILKITNTLLKKNN